MEKPEVILDRASELAKERLASMQKAEKEKAEKSKEESKGASSEKSSTEKEKTEGIEEKKKEETSEGTTKTDVEIVDSKDEDLTDEERTRKAELIKEREDAKTPEQKLADFQESVQKRIDALVGELKTEKESRVSDKETIKALEDRIAKLTGDLENSGSIESEEIKQTKSAEENYAKMVEEDKDLPRNQRREMSEEELEDFLLEDYSKANQWLVRRELRRERDVATQEKTKEAVKTIDEAAKTFFTKFPECDQQKRANELKAEGKTYEEAVEIVKNESPQFKLMMEIIQEDKKYTDPNNPEAPLLLMAEMEKRTGNSKKEPKTYTEEEVAKMKEEAIEAELKRRESIDEGVSGGNAYVPSFDSAMKDPLAQAQWKEWQIASKRPAAFGQDWSKEEFLKTLKYGKAQRKVSPI